MKFLIFFLSMVISFDYFYYLSNNKICGNKSESSYLLVINCRIVKEDLE